MIRAGTNIWSVGVALENPEFSGVDRSTENAQGVLPGLFGFSGDVEGFSQVVDRELPSLESEIRIQLTADAQSTAPSIRGFSSGDQFDPDDSDPPAPPGPSTPDPFTQAAGEMSGLFGVASIEPTPEIDASSNQLIPNLRSNQAVSFTWKNADVQEVPTPALLGFSADFDAAGSAATAPGLTGEAFGLGDFSHMIVVLPALAGAIDNNKAQILESLSATSQITIEVIASIREVLEATDSFTTQGSFRINVTEEMILSAAAIVPYSVEVAEALLAEVDTPTVALKLAQTFETLLAADSVDSLATLKLSIAMALTARDTIRANPHAAIDEILESTISSSARLTTFVELVDSLVAADQVDINGIFLVAAAEQAQFVDSVSTIATLQAAVEEGVATYISIRVGGEVIQGWVMNTSNAAFSEYGNYPFNSFAEIYGTYYGAAEDGIYELSGDDDDGQAIDAHIKTGLIDMGTHFIKDVKAAYIGFTATGRLVLKVTASVRGERKEYWYEMKPQSSDTMREGRFTIGRGIRSKYWQFEVSNLEGEDFELDGITALYNVLSRRLR